MGLFDRFRSNATHDAKSIRADLLYAIRTRLASFQGSEGSGVRSVHVLLAPPPTVRAEYEAAVFHGEPARFRAEIDRIADDFDLRLPQNWELKTEFGDTLPDGATPVDGHPAAIWIGTVVRQNPAVVAATIEVLQGSTQSKLYALPADGRRITIGRGARVQLPDGFLRENNIAFSDDSTDDANRFVSRQHAHIRFDKESGQFLLFADPGGLPPQNKTKVRARGEETAFKLQSDQVPHVLRDGDQLILGHSALLQFSTTQPDVNG